MGVLGERDSAGVLAYAKNNSCRGHMAKREQSLWHSETLLCQGKTGSGEVKKCSIHQVSVGFLYTSPARVVCCIHTMLRMCLHPSWTPDGKVPITCSIMGPAVRQCQGLRDPGVYLNNEYLVSVI